MKQGKYRLIETKNGTKILTLDNKYTFAWVYVMNIGEILITSYKQHKTDNILAIGDYKLYGIKDEKEFTDLLHLELFVGDNTWQGYLLPTGLPTDKKMRSRIIPTREVITNSLK